MKCSSCGTENLALARFCSKCGKTLAYGGSGSVIRGLRWYIAILLMLATTVNYLDRQTLSVAAPTIRKDFHLTNEQYAKIGTSFLIAYGIMHPISGRIIDWLGTRVGFSLAVLWWSIANMAHGLATGLWSLAGLRFLLGVGEAGNFPGAIKSVSEWFPAKERALATGILNVGAGAGAVIAPPLVGFLIWKFGWQTAFVVTGATGFLWVMLWLWLYQTPEKHPRLGADELALIRGGQLAEPVLAAGQSRGVWREALSRGDLWALMAARFISDPGWYFYLFWLPNYLSDVRGFSLAKIALFAWVPYLAADFGSLAGGTLSAWLVRRGYSTVAARKIAMCICAAMMPVAIPAVRAHSPYVALLFISIATTAHQAWAASLLTLPADLFPKRAVGSAYGFTGGCGILGSALFTMLVGWMVDHMGYVPVFSIVGFLHPTAALLVVLLVRGRSREDQHAFNAGFEVVSVENRKP